MKRQILLILMMVAVSCMAQESGYVEAPMYEGYVVDGETCLFVRRHFKAAQRISVTYHNFKKGERFKYATIDHGTPFKVRYSPYRLTEGDVERLEGVLVDENDRWDILDRPTSDYVRQYVGFISSVGDTVAWVSLLKEGIDIYGRERLSRELVRNRIRRVEGRARMGVAINITQRQMLSFVEW